MYVRLHEYFSVDSLYKPQCILLMSICVHGTSAPRLAPVYVYGASFTLSDYMWSGGTGGIVPSPHPPTGTCAYVRTLSPHNHPTPPQAHVRMYAHCPLTIHPSPPQAHVRMYIVPSQSIPPPPISTCAYVRVGGTNCPLTMAAILKFINCAKKKKKKVIVYH